MFKKWFILLIVLSCTIFAVSSGCSESGEDKNTDAVGNSEESDSADTVEENKEDSSENSVEDMEVESSGNSDDWCPVGSSWKTKNPQTGEEVTMKVVGSETIDGVKMCKAVYETNSEDEDFSKVEYLWSEDGNTFFWTAYNESGEKVSEFSMKDGKMKTVDQEGNVMEYSQNS